MLENYPQFSHLIEQTGWLLIHSLWQFALWALVALVLLKCLHRASSTARYTGLIAILLLMTLTPVVTWWFLPDAPRSVAETEVAAGPVITGDLPPAGDSRFEPDPFHDPKRLPNLRTEIEWEDSTGQSGHATIDDNSNHAGFHFDEPGWLTTWSAQIHQALEPWLEWIVGLWFVGMLVFSLRPLAGWSTMRRLSRKGISDAPEHITDLLRETAGRLGIRKAVSAFQSSLVRVPLVTGFLRPMILLPASVVTGFPPAQLQAILAHELAHIRRYDPFVNLWQTLVETVFFYHPLVWWLSHQIRCERESCCDDLAVSITGGKVEYSRALLALDELRGTSSALALSSHGGSLSSRVRRLVTGEPSSHRVGLLGIVAFLILLTGIALFFMFWNPNVPSHSNLKTDSSPLSEPAMSAEEQAAWDALDSSQLFIMGEANHRLFMRRNIKRLEHQKHVLNYSWPEEMLRRKRQEANQPIHSAEFWRVPKEAWPQIARLQSLNSLTFVGTDLRGKPMETISRLKNLRRLHMTGGQCELADLVRLKELPELQHVETRVSISNETQQEWENDYGELTAEEKSRLEAFVSQKPPSRQDRSREVMLTALYTDRAIRELVGLKRLRSFKLEGTFVTDASLEVFAQMPELQELKLSVITSPPVSPNSIGEISTLRSFSQSHADNETLQELSTLSNLERLNVWADGVTSEGIPHLLKLKNLKRLEIRGNRLDDAGLIQLAQLPQLEYLNIKSAKGPLSLAGVLAFQEKKPDCRLEADDDLPLVSQDQTKPDAEESKPEADPEEDENDIPILERKVSLAIRQFPLREALQMVGERANVEIVIDEPHLKQANLDLDRPVDVEFENLILGEVLGELIDWQAHPGVFREVRGGKLILTTLAARRKQVQQHLPAWLKPFLDNGMSARLDDNNEVEELYFGDVITDDLLAKLKTLPELRNLNIEVTTQLTPAGLAHLGELDKLHRLEVYSINKDEGLGDDILKSISGLKKLRELSIGQCGVTDEGLKNLEQMPQLTSLRLNNEGLLTDDCLSSIAKLENLKTLSMSSYVSTAQYGWMRFSAEALAQLSALHNLEELYLAGQPFPGDSFTFTKLKSLDVSGDQVDDEFVKKLAQCPNLRRLNLWRTRVTDAGLKLIVELPELRKLSLFDIPITDEGLRALMSAKKLEHLELRELNITDTGIGYVGHIKTLTRLDLHSCSGTTVDGLQQLKTLPKFQTLYLTNFPDQTGYRELSQLKHLRELSFLMCGILYEEWKWLKTAMPRTQIHHMTGGGGFSMWEPSLPEAKVKLPKLPEELQPQEEQQPQIPFKQPEPDPKENPVEEEQVVIPPRPLDPADVDAPLPQQVSRKNPPDWAARNSGDGWKNQFGIVGFLPNNTLLAVANGRSNLEILDPTDGTALRTLPGGEQKIHSWRMSQNRRRVLCVMRPPEELIKLNWPDYSVTYEVREFPAFELVGKSITRNSPWFEGDVTISANGDFIASGDSKGVSIWDVQSGKQLKQAPSEIKSIRTLAFSPDGRWLVISRLGDLIFWEWQTEKPPQSIHVGRHTWSLTFTPDSRYLFEGPDSRRDIQVRDLKTMEVVRRLKDDTGHSMSVTQMQLTNRGKTLVAGNSIGYDWRKVIVNDRLHFWDIETGKILRKFDFTRHDVGRVFVSPDGGHLVAVIFDDHGEVMTVGWDLKKLDADKPD